MTRDVFEIKIHLQFPAINDNMSSHGNRLYETDLLTGYMNIYYLESKNSSYGIIYYEPYIEISNLKNETYTLPSGNKVTYTMQPIYTAEFNERFLHYIGYNNKDYFPYPSIQFGFVATPNFITAIDSEAEGADNQLYAFFSGAGTSKYNEETKNYKAIKFNGTLVGQVGCGCAAYGHTSPTRIATASGAAATQKQLGDLGDTSTSDIASTFGTWSAEFIKTEEISIDDCSKFVKEYIEEYQ